MKTIFKVILHHKNKKSKTISTIGFIIGLTIMLLSIELYINVKSISKENDSSVDNDLLIVSKKVTTSLLSKKNNTFTEKELTSLRNSDFVNDMAPFLSCDYNVFVEVGDDKLGIPNLYTMAFFEAIPSKFIDIKIKDWNWDPSHEIIPIILPKNYLDAYNFGIAITANTPQISADLLKGIVFKIHVRGNNKRQTFIGSVVGLSSKINSILVPESFINYTNKIYGNYEKRDINRIAISTKNIQDPAIKKYLSENNLTTSNNISKENVVQKLANGVLSYQIIICLIIIIQGVLLILFYTKMIMYDAKREIQQLSLIGYSNSIISKTIEKTLINTYFFIFGSCLALTYLCKFLISQQLKNSLELEINPFINMWTILIYVLLLTSFILINRNNLKNKLIEFQTSR